MRRSLALMFLALFATSAMAIPPPPRPPSPPSAPAKAPVPPGSMRQYVLVMLKTGPTPVPAGKRRDDMFKGHFANMERLAGEGKLAVAGPITDRKGYRGMFIFAVDSLDEAKALVATDPVIRNGEMVAEYHTLYSSKALMSVNELHGKLESGP